MKTKNMEKLKSLSTLLNIFIRPTQTAKQIDEKPNFWLPLGVYTGFIFLFYYYKLFFLG